MTQRTRRIDEQLRQEIGQALEREVSDPRIGFTTVTKVETSADLSYARVWVSVLGSPAERKQTLAALRGAVPFIRRSLGAKLRLRRIPALDVRLDDSLERGTRVLHILDELERGVEPEGDPAVGTSLPTPVRRLGREGDAPEPAPEPASVPVTGRRVAGRHPPSGRGSGHAHGGRGSAGRSPR
jgi:ribosome-binding factor A